MFTSDLHLHKSSSISISISIISNTDTCTVTWSPTWPLNIEAHMSDYDMWLCSRFSSLNLHFPYMYVATCLSSTALQSLVCCYTSFDPLICVHVHICTYMDKSRKYHFKESKVRMFVVLYVPYVCAHVFFFFAWALVAIKVVSFNDKLIFTFECTCFFVLVL